jgi:ATP-dependent Zn protease
MSPQADTGNGGAKPGLAWPDHDTGPVPPAEYKSRPRDDELPMRKPLAPFDRVKLLLAIVALFLFFFWGAASDNPIISTRDAFWDTVRSKPWLLGLLVLEAVRQLHYLISERNAGYHRFWKERVFGGVDRRFSGINDWTRFRIARTIKWGVFLVILDLVLASAFNVAPATALFELPVRLVQALPFVFQFAILFFVIIIQFVGLAWYAGRQGIDVYFPDDVKTRFSDVWGQDAVLARVQENIVFLEDPESIEAKGGHVPSGILLWGPPGTGKTLMAEAVAGETGKPYVFVDPGGLTSFGFGALAVKGVFRKLRKLAVRYGGVIVFFDEADALGSRGALPAGGPFGGQMSGHNQGPWATNPSCNGLSYLAPDTASMLLHTGLEPSAVAAPRSRRRDGFFMMGGMGGGGMLQALLTEISGLKKPRGILNRYGRRLLGMRPKPPPKYRILVMMATNMPQALDEALLRPGRIDRIYKVGYPSKEGRVRTYEGYLDKVQHRLTPADIDKLATITPYATGATIKDLINEALIHAIREDRDTIDWRDIVKAKQLKDLGPPENVEYIERERHAVAVHEACHAVTAYRIRHHLTIDIATIEKGGTYLGMVASIPPEDQFTQWRSEYEADIIVSLASLAGERLFFDGDNSSGVSGDLEGATQIATLMEGYWGMGSTVACHGVTQRVGIGGGGKPGDDEKKREKQELLRGTLGERIEEKLSELLARSELLLADNRRAVLAVAHALETNKTLTGEDIEAIIEGIPGPLVDGQVYATAEFAEVAERYHAMVLAAHKGHGRVEIPLPVLNGNGHKPHFTEAELVVDPWATPSGIIDPRPPDAPSEA